MRCRAPPTKVDNIGGAGAGGLHYQLAQTVGTSVNNITTLIVAIQKREIEYLSCLNLCLFVHVTMLLYFGDCARLDY